MSCFRVEVPVPQWDAADIERATRTLLAAQSRLSDGAGPRVASITSGDGRLVCLVEAASVDAVRRLLALALLPAARVRQVTGQAGPGLRRGASRGG